MANIDENVQVGIDLTVTSMKLTAKILISIMEYFLQREDKQNMYQDLDNKQGKQKLKDLFSKNQNSGIESLDSNISKTEIMNIQKELKDMGIDFSVRKIGKDDYSLFFAGKDREAIEKGMKNAISKYNNKKVKTEKVKEKLSFSVDMLKDKAKELKNKQKEELVNTKTKKQSR